MTREERRGQQLADENNRLLAGDLITWLEKQLGFPLNEVPKDGVRSWMSSAFHRGIERGKTLERRRRAKKCGDR